VPFLHNTLKKTQLHWTWTSDTKWMDNKFLEESFVHRPASLVHGSLPSGRARESASGPPLCRDCWLELESIGSDDRAAAGRAAAAGRFHARADSDCTSDQMHDSDAVPPVGSQGSRRESDRAPEAAKCSRRALDSGPPAMSWPTLHLSLQPQGSLYGARCLSPTKLNRSIHNPAPLGSPYGARVLTLGRDSRPARVADHLGEPAGPVRLRSAIVGSGDALSCPGP
jgi:hypothetical protein